MTSPPDDVAGHETSLAVWDLASPMVIDRQATLKVGITCPSGCSLAGAHIEIRDEQGTSIGSGRVGSASWPGTTALYWVEVAVTAPDTEGDHAWSVHAIPLEPSHRPVTSVVRVVACRPPEHRVTFDVIEQGSAAPVAGVELRLGSFRAATDSTGLAHIHVPGGTYDVCAWKSGYDLLSTTARISENAPLRLELTLTPQTEQPYWM